MKIFTVTLTGADESVDPKDLLYISDKFPWVEWGILLSSKKSGSPRYPAANWVSELSMICKDRDRQAEGVIRPKFAAHLCGDTMRSFMRGITFEHYDSGAWIMPHGLDLSGFNRLFGRAQANFNASREGFTDDHLQCMLEGWYETMDGALISQHNPANSEVWKPLQRIDQSYGSIRSHHILHDASGGRGLSPQSWERPIAGALNGYAGGIGPDNVIDTLHALEPIVGQGYIWIDMEGKLRSRDDAFDLEAAEKMLKDIEQVAIQQGWL